MSRALTEEIAAAAAQLVVESGMEYGQAKQKAARALGRRSGGRAAMPTNEQVEDQVRNLLEIFCADTQPQELQVLRGIAAGWMERMAAFRPHLAGAVWRGTATRHNAVHLDLYCDDPKAAQIAILNMGIEHDVDTIDADGPSPVTVLTTASPGPNVAEPVTVHLFLRDLDELRGALKPDAQGRSWRGDLPALRVLMGVEWPRTGDAP